MIKVEKLTKRYGSVTAVDAIDFEVDKGEIVGILGTKRRGQEHDGTNARVLSAAHLWACRSCWM